MAKPSVTDEQMKRQQAQALPTIPSVTVARPPVTPKPQTPLLPQQKIVTPTNPFAPKPSLAPFAPKQASPFVNLAPGANAKPVTPLLLSESSQKPTVVASSVGSSSSSEPATSATTAKSDSGNRSPKFFLGDDDSNSSAGSLSPVHQHDDKHDDKSVLI